MNSSHHRPSSTVIVNSILVKLGGVPDETEVELETFLLDTKAG